MKVLITGAYGFVGTNLSAHLDGRGVEVWALDVEGTLTETQKPQSVYKKRFRWEELGKIQWDEVDAVIHLAGKAHDTRNASSPQSYFDINVGLTEKIVSSLVQYCESALVGKPEDKGQRTKVGIGSTNELMQCRTHALPKFILFSSVKAVADRVEGALTEDAVPDPKTPYGQSKLEAEKVVRSSFVQYCESALVSEEVDKGRRRDCGTGTTTELTNSRTNELFYYILRPCMIHGPGNKGNLNLLYGMVRRGIPWPLGGFENRRSFASIGNVCAVVDGLIKGDVPSGIYQVADDEALSTNELVGLMSDVMGRRARVWRIPAGLMRATARLGDVLHLPLNSERLKKLTESYIVSNNKLKAALGWKSMPVRAQDGLRFTFESFTLKNSRGS